LYLARNDARLAVYDVEREQRERAFDSVAFQHARFDRDVLRLAIAAIDDRRDVA
jgi:hypothetical protein